MHILLLSIVLAALPLATAKADPLSDAIARGDYPKTTSVLVMRNGKVVYEAYFNDGGRDVLNDTRSAMKAITALAVGAALADGWLKAIDEPVFPVLSDLKPFANPTPDKDAVTLSDMMSMSSALDCNDNDDVSPGNEDRMHEQTNWTRWAVDLPTMAGYQRDASGLGPWRYCTANAFLAGQIVERVTHRSFDAYVKQRLLAPLNIARWEWPRSPSGEVMTGGGLRLRTRDLGAIASMMANEGSWQGHQVLPKDWIDQMLTIRRASRPDQNYGYFVFEGDYKTACGPKPVWYMAGNGGSQILILRDLNAAVVLTRTNYNVRGTSATSQELIEKYLLPLLPCS